MAYENTSSEDEQILYDLLVHAEWPKEEELLVRNKLLCYI